MFRVLFDLLSEAETEHFYPRTTANAIPRRDEGLWSVKELLARGFIEAVAFGSR